MNPTEHGDGSFPVTRWTLVERAGDGQFHLRRLALEELLRLYWPALQARLRRRGRTPLDQIDDVLQGFVCDKIVEDDLLKHCIRGEGKFRTFLLTTLDRYLVDQHRRRRADRRAPDRAAALDPDFDIASTSEGDPSDESDLVWARQALGEALRRMRLECEDTGRLDVWHVLNDRLLAPMLEGAAVVSYEDLARRFNLPDPMQAANLLTTGKRSFRRKLREVVGQYAANDQEAEREILELRQILATGKGYGRNPS